MSGAENFLRFLGGVGGGDNAFMRTADAMNPEAAYRRQVLEERQRVREAILNNPQVLGQLSKTVPNADQYLQQGGSLEGLGQLQDIMTPKLTDFQEKMQTLQQVGQMTPEMRELYTGLFGKGGVTVNTGNTSSPYQEKFQENLGKQAAEQIAALDTQASDYSSQTRSAEQALSILQTNPDIQISPFSPLSNTIKSTLSDFFTEDELKNVADYQTLDSQLIRNRFDVTKVLKGAITEQEQAAAQTVAGKPTGTREGLEQTLKNNIAYGILQQDYAQKKRDFILEQGEAYSPTKFEKYYKQLGENGQRPTLDQLLGKVGLNQKGAGIKAGSKVKWSDL
jgi:hypothetical protein